MEVADEETNHKYLYAYFGLASYHSQCLEMDIGNILVAYQRLHNKTITLKELEDYEEEMQRKTLGILLKSVKKITSFDSNAENLLAEALSKRNYLVHHYFREHASDMLSYKGRDKMTEELKEIINLFKAADAVAKAVSMVYVKILGVTEEMIEQEFHRIQRGEPRII